MQVSGLDHQRITLLNQANFSKLSNGGLGQLPDPVQDDSKTTDEVVQRTYEYPTMLPESVAYRKPESGDYYRKQRNRVATAAPQVSQLALRGVKVYGADATGQYNILLTDPGAMETNLGVTASNDDGATSVLLWVVIIIGAISLFGNALARPVPVA